jgi:hypothetical protein
MSSVSIGVNSVFVSRPLSRSIRPQNNNLVQNTPSAKPSGFLSDRVKCSLRALLTNWLTAEIPHLRKLKRTPFFVTLTLPPSVSCLSAPVIRRRFLSPFLLDLGRAGCSHWFWISEIGSNGHTHFHLICSSFPVSFFAKWRCMVASVSSNCCVTRPVRSAQKLIGYLLKGSDVAQEGRLWGSSRQVKEFRNIRIKGLEAERFLVVHKSNLKYQLTFDFGDLFVPKPRLSRKIITHFCKLRKYQDKFSISVGSTSLPLPPLLFIF